LTSVFFAACQSLSLDTSKQCSGFPNISVINVQKLQSLIDNAFIYMEYCLQVGLGFGLIGETMVHLGIGSDTSISISGPFSFEGEVSSHLVHHGNF
jgi:hypothetical protein